MMGGAVIPQKIRSQIHVKSGYSIRLTLHTYRIIHLYICMKSSKPYAGKMSDSGKSF